MIVARVSSLSAGYRALQLAQAAKGALSSLHHPTPRGPTPLPLPSPFSSKLAAAAAASDDALLDAAVRTPDASPAAVNPTPAGLLPASAVFLSAVTASYFWFIVKATSNTALVVLLTLVAVTSYLLFASAEAGVARGVEAVGAKKVATTAVVWWALAVTNTVYFGGFWLIAWIAWPNLERLFPSMNLPLVSATVAMLIPAGLLFAHAQRLL